MNVLKLGRKFFCLAFYFPPFFTTFVPLSDNMLSSFSYHFLATLSALGQAIWLSLCNSIPSSEEEVGAGSAKMSNCLPAVVAAVVAVPVKL